MPTPYQRGRAFEYKTKRDLEERGIHVLRSSGSHSPVDLVGISPGAVLCIQCKMGAGNAGGLLKFCNNDAVIPMLATSHKNGRRVSIRYTNLLSNEEVTDEFFKQMVGGKG